MAMCLASRLAVAQNVQRVVDRVDAINQSVLNLFLPSP